MTAALTLRRTAAFDAALRGDPAVLLRSDGARLPLDVDRWRDPAGAADSWLLDRCTGPVVDLGCGPGRLVAALAERGVAALGVDVSRAAQAQCRRRGVPMLRRDVFARLPGEGGWSHVLLADGNIGIGGDPRRLLRRAGRLLRPGGTVLVECDPEPELYWCGSARVSAGGAVGAVVPWAAVGVAALRRVALAAGLGVGGGHHPVLELIKL